MKRLLVLGSLLLLAGRVEAQCQPTNQPNLAQSQQPIKPSQMTTAAVTMNLTTSAGASSAFHAGTMGAGTQLSINWNTWNSASQALWGKLDTDQNWTEWGSLGANGSLPLTIPASWVGHVAQLKVVATEKQGSGSFTPTTQDIATLTVTSDPAGVSISDESPSNVYVLVSGIYSGTPNIPYQTTCTQAAEKDMAPTAQLQVANTSSGESRNGVSMNGATTVVGQPVYATAFDYISALPGDTITGTFQGITYCTAIGNVFSHLQWFRIEEARTVVKDLGHPPRVGPDGGSEYDVAPICQNDCDPPDWPVNVVDSFSGRHPYWVAVTSCLRAPDVDGAPWICAADYMYDIENTVGELDVLEMLVRGIAAPYPSALPIPGKCTKYPVNVLATLGPGDIKRFFGFGNN